MLSAEPVKEEAESQEATKRPFIEAGWYRDLSNEAYHGSFGYSSSGLKILIEHTPAHLVYPMAHRFGADRQHGAGHCGAHPGTGARHVQ